MIAHVSGAPIVETSTPRYPRSGGGSSWCETHNAVGMSSFKHHPRPLLRRSDSNPIGVDAVAETVAENQRTVSSSMIDEHRPASRARVGGRAGREVPDTLVVHSSTLSLSRPSEAVT